MTITNNAKRVASAPPSAPPPAGAPPTTARLGAPQVVFGGFNGVASNVPNAPALASETLAITATMTSALQTPALTLALEDESNFLIGSLLAKIKLQLATKLLVSEITPRKKRNPIVICPGVGCTNLDYTFNNNKKCDCKLPECNNVFGKLIKSQSGSLWINIIGLLLNRPCALAITKPNYDKKTQTLTNINGLEVTIHGSFPGDVYSCKYLAYIPDSNIGMPETNYADNFVKYFETYGYKNGVDMFAVGYDFRLVPFKQYQSDYFKIFKKVVEKAYYKANPHRKHGDLCVKNDAGVKTPRPKKTKKVHVLGHSLGGSLMTIFLNKMKSSWKKKYIASYIADCPALDGGPKSLRTILSGYNFGFPIKIAGPNAEWAPSERNMAGILASIPLKPEMYGYLADPNDQYQAGNGLAVILENIANKTSKSYNVNDYKNGIVGLIRDVAKDTKTPGLETSADILEEMVHEREKYGYSDPGVRVNLLVVNTLSTESGAYTYDMSGSGLKTDPLSNSTLLGDDDVTIWGQTIPKRNKWKNLKTKVFSNLNGQNTHYTMFVGQTPAFAYIRDLIAPR